MSTQNVNVARFARNVEWDLFCDFLTLCVFIILCEMHFRPLSLLFCRGKKYSGSACNGKGRFVPEFRKKLRLTAAKTSFLLLFVRHHSRPKSKLVFFSSVKFSSIFCFSRLLSVSFMRFIRCMEIENAHFWYFRIYNLLMFDIFVIQIT